MKDLLTFENTEVKIIVVNGEPLFELYSTGMALGQVKYAKGRAYPRKDRIDENIKSADIMPVVHNGQLFLNESQLYDLMLEIKTDKVKPFRKWIVNEVLPTLNRTGKYEMPSRSNSSTYFDKFWNGEKVITIKDFEYFTGANQGMINYYVSSSLNKGTEYYLLEGIELQQFKYLNTRYHKQVAHLILLNYKGCLKLAELLKCNISNAECFKYVPYMNKALPEKKTDNKPYYVTVSRDPSAYEKLGELKNMATALSSMLDLVGKADTPIKKFVPYLETLMLMSFDFSIEVSQFYKMVDVKEWI